MDLILDNINPKTIEAKDITNSNIWGNNLTFSSKKNYLIRSVSGKGKSTLINYLSGLRNDFDGQLIIGEIKSSELNSDNWIEKRKNEIALVNQDLKLISSLSVIENLVLKNELTNHVDKETINQLLKEVGIFDLKNKKCSQLSIGQQQRVAIVKSLLQPFDWILLDEPFSNLDETNQIIALNLIIKVAENQNAGIILTTLETNQEIPNFKSIDL